MTRHMRAVAALVVGSLSACSAASTTAGSTTSPTDASLSALGPSSSQSSTTSATTGASTNTAPPTSSASTSSTIAEVNPSGDIPDNQVFVAYRPATGGWSIKVPEGWARTSAAGAVVFSDHFNSITITTSTASSAPTPASVTAGELPDLAKQKGFHPGNVTSVSRKAGAAVLVTYTVDSAQNTVTNRVIALAVERYEFWKAGTTVSVAVAGPVGADNVDPWRTVTDSFGWS